MRLTGLKQGLEANFFGPWPLQEPECLRPWHLATISTHCPALCCHPAPPSSDPWLSTWVPLPRNGFFWIQQVPFSGIQELGHNNNDSQHYEHLGSIWHCAECFKCIISFIPQSSPIKEELSPPPFLQVRNSLRVS